MIMFPFLGCVSLIPSLLGLRDSGFQISTNSQDVLWPLLMSQCATDEQRKAGMAPRGMTLAGWLKLNAEDSESKAWEFVHGMSAELVHIPEVKSFFVCSGERYFPRTAIKHRTSVNFEC